MTGSRSKETGPRGCLSGSPAIGRSLLYTRITPVRTESGAFHELGSLFSYAVLNRHACVLHGVVMEYPGQRDPGTGPGGNREDNPYPYVEGPQKRADH